MLGPLAAGLPSPKFHAYRAQLPALKVLVKFTAAWCPPCRALQPTLEVVAKDRPGLQVLSVDVDEQQATAQRFGVRALPTLLVFRGGQVAGQAVGNQSRAAVERLLGD